MPSSISPLMNRNRISMVASLLLLSSVIVIWPDIFNFSKTVRLPDWTALLPSPIDAPAFLALLCLIPAALISTTLQGAIRGVAVSVVVAPLFAIATFALDPTHQNSFSVANAFFSYVWIVLFYCAIPSVLLLSVRATAHYLHTKARC